MRRLALHAEEEPQERVRPRRVGWPGLPRRRPIGRSSDAPGRRSRPAPRAAATRTFALPSLGQPGDLVKALPVVKPSQRVQERAGEVGVGLGQVFPQGRPARRVAGLLECLAGSFPEVLVAQEGRDRADVAIGRNDDRQEPESADLDLARAGPGCRSVINGPPPRRDLLRGRARRRRWRRRPAR